ncbi:MAG: hypothetical protein R3A52_25720 [Polyangiales bacterium]
MAIAVGPDGAVDVLDARNQRVQRFSRGVAVASAGPVGEATQDITHLPDGRLVTVDRLGTGTVTVFDRDGHPGATVPLRGGPIAEGGAVTGVFADADGVYVENAHREVVRVADANGHEDPARPTLWGRPSRDGAQLLRAAIEDRMAGTVRVIVAARENGAIKDAGRRWFRCGRRCCTSADARGAARGASHVAATVARSRRRACATRRWWWRASTARGALDGVMRLPPLAGEDELFRPVTVDDDGGVYVMDATPAGLVVRRYGFAPD